MPQTITLPGTNVETGSMEEHEPMFHVVLLDDDDHTYDYVIEMLTKLFLMTEAQAYNNAVEVDATGRTIVMTCALPQAEFGRDQIHAYGADWRMDRVEGFDERDCGTCLKKVIMSKTPSLDPAFCSYRLRLAHSKIHRWGVYAEARIPPGKKVIEYTGELISRRETKRRADNDPEHVYLFTIDSYWAKDGASGGSGAEYINHSCDPNLRTLILKGHILYMSLRPIKKGEELTVDYNFDTDAEKHACGCGAKICRGTINRK